jgi:hypothetical protein
MSLILLANSGCSSTSGQDIMPAAQARTGTEWANVVVVGETTTKGGDAKVRCIHCDKEFVGGASRIASHLLHERGRGIGGCPEVPEVVVAELTEKKQERGRAATIKEKKRKLNSLAEKALLPVSTQASLQQVLAGRTKKL